MREKLYLESDSSFFRRFVLLPIIVLLMVVGFVLSAVVFLSLSHVMFYGFNEQSLADLGHFWLSCLTRPQRLWEAYAEWFYVFRLAAAYHKLVPASFMPLLGPLLFIGATVWAYVKSPSSFKLWYRLKNHYAKFEDVQKMGILNGTLFALGRFQNQVLRLCRPLSVFVWGGEGLGKSSCVSLPSVLESDDTCLAVADSTGILAKYSSGYRSRLGKVFYFNWGLTDVPEKGEFWPRWNPVSPKDLPVRGEGRLAYIKMLVSCLFPSEKHNFWEKISQTALEGLLLFYVSKIEQAMANDYFLSGLLEKGRIAKEDRELLQSYYRAMNPELAAPALKALESGKLTLDNYLPVGSWENVSESWRGKEFCLPMFADCLMQRYFAITQEDEEKAAVGGFKVMLGEFIKEAQVFGYDRRAIQVMQQLYYMTRKQRRIIFTMLMAPLTVFRKSTIRSRTSLSDFSLNQLRGICEDGSWRVTTLYTVADAVKSSGFMSRFLIDMLIAHNLRPRSEEGPFALAFVLDDFERLPKLSKLAAGLTQGPELRMSFLMLTDGLHLIQNKYGMEELEDIIGNSSVKLMMAEDKRRMSEHFNKLAVYGTRSVQIPAVDAGAFYKVKKGLADANYYHRIARDLMNHPKTVSFDKSHYLLLVEGFYHLPVNISSNNFLRDGKLKSKAACGACYILDETLAAQRNVQDVDAPDLIAVLQEGGINIEKEEDVDIYLEDKYDEVVETLEEDSDVQTVWAEEISNRWNSAPSAAENPQDLRVKNDDWWLDEEAFKTADSDNANPFESLNETN